MDTEHPPEIIDDIPRCRVVIKKEAGSTEDFLCNEPASCQWPILADDGETVLDILLACPYHEHRYDDGHTLIAKDIRGFVHMFGLSPGLHPEDEGGNIEAGDDASRLLSGPIDPDASPNAGQ